ncbi:hypothetical protein ACM66B_002406 [Microbotryomycetes sp. NB124-2]
MADTVWPHASSSRSSSPPLSSPSELSLASSPEPERKPSRLPRRPTVKPEPTDARSEIDELASDDDGHTKANGAAQQESSVERRQGKRKLLLGPELESEFVDWQPQACQWEGCGQSFWEMEPLVDHLLDHLPPSLKPGQKQPPYYCKWIGCFHFDKPQYTRFVMMNHLRSHTGEKPFHCHIPECDRAFTRADLLAKHVRTNHDDSSSSTIPATADGSSSVKTGRSVASFAERARRAFSTNSEDSQAEDVGEVALQASATDGGAVSTVDANTSAERDEFLTLSTEEMDLLHKHAAAGTAGGGSGGGATDGWAMLYVVLMAKYEFQKKERHELVHELQALETREMELKGQCEELMVRVLENEVAGQDQVAKHSVDTFMREYNDELLKPPRGWRLS